MSVVLLMLACGGVALPPPPLPDAGVDAFVAAMDVDEGDPVELTVRVRTTPGWTVELSPPQSEGLQPTLVQSQGPVQVGDTELRTWRWDLTGPPGSYVISPGVGQVQGPAGETGQLEAPPVFVDIGVPGPTSQVSDFQAAPPPSGPNWAVYAIVAGGLLLAGAVGAGMWWAGSRTPQVVVPPDPPHVQAREAWRSTRAAGHDDHTQAVALSMVLRRYLQAITGWPATMRTGPEILRWMEDESIAGATARLHAARILDATDRLKFAREGGGPTFFAALDEDFDVVVEATRPAGPAPAAGGAA